MLISPIGVSNLFIKVRCNLIMRKISKNKLCAHIDSNVPVEFVDLDSELTIRYEPAGDTKVLLSDSGKSTE